MCTHCHKAGHRVDTCYRNHGFSPNYFSNPGTINNFVTAEHDDELGYKDDCNKDINVSKNIDESLPTFTHEQHKALITFLQQQSSGDSSHNTNQIVVAPKSSTSCLKGSHYSIMDSGATNHVCHSLLLFQSFKKIEPISIKLPNGSLLVHIVKVPYQNQLTMR
ncbi:hypothetical protein Lal_00028443 [Lupinus albus]|nr:hypothetical protein Lal_00028443 [Lupinus albus]